MKNKGEIIFMAIFGFVIIASLILTAANCDGTLVRGLFWYECIPD